VYSICNYIIYHRTWEHQLSIVLISLWVVSLKGEFNWYTISDMFHWHRWYYLAHSTWHTLNQLWLSNSLDPSASEYIPVASVFLTDFWPTLMLLLSTLERLLCCHGPSFELSDVFSTVATRFVWTNVSHVLTHLCRKRSSGLITVVVLYDCKNFVNRCLSGGSLPIFTIAIFITCITCSAAQLLAGWYSSVHVFLIPLLTQNSSKSLEVNCSPLSLSISLGRSKLAKIL